jgi:hypothetical protein
METHKVEEWKMLKSELQTNQNHLRTIISSVVAINFAIYSLIYRSFFILSPVLATLILFNPIVKTIQKMEIFQKLGFIAIFIIVEIGLWYFYQMKMKKIHKQIDYENSLEF